jgi:type I restriction enzyme, S subunit
MIKGWQDYKLGDVIHIKHGYAFKGEYFTDEETENILVTPGNFNIGGGFKSDKLKYYKGPVPHDYILNENDVIVTMTDLSKMADTLGFSAKVPIKSGNVYLHNQRIGLVVIKNNNISLNYLYWLMRFEVYQKFVSGSATGATVKHTSPTKIYAFKFKAPPLLTQHKIASILSAYDDLIENNLKRIKLLEEMAQKTYEEWFVKFRIDGVKLPINKETGLPAGWERKRIGKILDNIRSTKKIKSSEILNEGIIPVVDQGRPYVAGFTNDVYACINVSEPLIVFGDHTRVLKFVNFSFARGADGTQILLSKEPRMPQHLFYHSLKEVDLSNYHYARHFKFLKEEEIVLPDIDSAQKFESKISKNYESIKILRNQNQKLKEARDILLPRLLSGMIDVEKM